jgi:putative toxin-antitoxin system antitoxin component (TIGR02293 family)
MRATSDVFSHYLDPSQSSAARVADVLGLASGIRSEVDLIDRLEQGLSVSTVQSLRMRAGLTDEEVFQLVAPRRTLSRRLALDQKLTPEEADKTVRVARIAAHAQQVFVGDPAYVGEWLRSPQETLGERSPLQALTTESGALAVEELLVGIEHGMFA